ncbi:MAG: TAXI family TRAP transporter solute-binding subunit [Alphaproteobacteria bacterium]
MTTFKLGAAVGMVAAAGLFGGDVAQAQDQQFFSIGTGGLTGVYYPAGGAICRMVNRDRGEHGFRCSVESTGGSIFNINAVKGDELEFGVVQSDWQYHAYNGSSRFEDEPFPEIRAVFSLHPEPFTLVVRDDVDVENFPDLEGLRVNVGNPGSGTRATMEVVLDAYDMSMDDFALAAEFAPNEMARQLCDGNIDAFVYPVGHPAAAIEEAATTCNAQLADVAGEPIDALVEERPYYAIAEIPGGMYPGNDDGVTTFGVRATFITREEVSEDVVYTVAKGVMENMDDFRDLHPAFEVLERDQMVEAGLSAPLHPGAERAYQELDLME